MIVELTGLSAAERRLTGEDPPAILELDESRDVRDIGAIRYDVAVCRTAVALVVRGTLDLDLSFRCSRCAEFFGAHIREPAFESSRDVAPGVESVDLTDDIRETILLAFPNYPVCRADCKGLCPQCGADLSKGGCRCRPPEEFRWGAMDELHLG